MLGCASCMLWQHAEHALLASSAVPRGMVIHDTSIAATKSMLILLQACNQPRSDGLASPGQHQAGSVAVPAGCVCRGTLRLAGVPPSGLASSMAQTQPMMPTGPQIPSACSLPSMLGCLLLCQSAPRTSTGRHAAALGVDRAKAPHSLKGCTGSSRQGCTGFGV